MQLKTGDSSIITSKIGCGSIRQEIQMKDTSLGSICTISDFDTRPSAKKICFTNGLVFEVIDYQTLRVTANSVLHIGTYELWIWSYHVDISGTRLWSVRATPLTLIISGQVINCNIQICSLKVVNGNKLTITHPLSGTGISKSTHYLDSKVTTSSNCTKFFS